MRRTVARVLVAIHKPLLAALATPLLVGAVVFAVSMMPMVAAMYAAKWAFEALGVPLPEYLGWPRKD